MRCAVELGRQGKGFTAPNPCVGAVLVKDGRIAAFGFHRAYGEDHAEVAAIQDARAKKIDTSQCDLYVTLEPCNHHGKTPPCTQAVLEAGIKTVYIGALDPNPDVEGRGAEHLRENGVVVKTKIAEQECLDLIADFLVWKTTKRPYVYLKLASTLDGKIATRSGHSAWVSGPESREAVHRLRSRVQAVIIGSRTFVKDDPRLTCRLKEFTGNHPLAVIVGTTVPHPDKDLHLFTIRAKETVFWTSEDNMGHHHLKTLEQRGVRVYFLPAKENNKLDLLPGLCNLRQNHGCYDILCEGGGTLAMSMVEQNIMDEFWLFLAPKILGDAGGTPPFSGRLVHDMKEAIKLRMMAHEQVGQDFLIQYRPGEK